MEYLNVIEENFTKEEFVAYLRGRILEYLLSEEPLVLSEFKRYANKLVDVVKDPSVGSAIVKEPQVVSTVKEPQKEPTEIEMLQTPVGYIKVGDVVGYDNSNKRIRFGTITRLSEDGLIDLTHRYSVVFGTDNKQVIYQSMDGSIESYRVCWIL